MHKEPDKTENSKGIVGYLTDNPGAPLVIGFIILLMESGWYYYEGQKAIADFVAVGAFYCIITGVALQTTRFLLDKRNQISEYSFEVRKAEP